MRKTLLIFALAVAIPTFPQSMKMVVDSLGNVVGRYVSTNANTYTVGVQDYVEVPKAGNKVVIFRAKDGQGVVWCKKNGEFNVRDIPSQKGTVIGKIVCEEYVVPDTYPCLGKEKGWYKISIDGKTGYVRQDLVNWDGMDTF